MACCSTATETTTGEGNSLQGLVSRRHLEDHLSQLKEERLQAAQTQLIYELGQQSYQDAP